MCCLRAWDHGYGEGAGSLLITDRPRHLQVLQKKTAHTLASLLKNADWAKTVHRHKADEAQWRHDPPRLGLAESNLHPRSTQEYPRKSVSGPLSGVAGTEDYLLGCPLWTFGVKSQGIMAVFWCALGIGMFQVAGDYKYHPECFVCLSCRVVIEDQDTYALVERTKLYWWVTSHISPPNCTCIYCRLYWSGNITLISSKL